MPDNLSLQCYNRGCGQKYDPDTNTKEKCRHHPGEPFFHDAYKGWSCCNKKCTDFTEFLNIKGCTLSAHSNVKPPEPEKPEKPENPAEIIEVKPIVASTLKRPSFDTKMTVLVPEIASNLKKLLENTTKPQNTLQTESGEVPIGTICKNGGCRQEFTGPDSNLSSCTYHPGIPVFHEGLKFWTCCLKKTTDFNAFLSQVGCNIGSHVWLKSTEESTKVECRWDFHQTASFIVVSIYAKQYCPKKSVVQISPVRLNVHLLFPEQDNGSFDLDIELKGIINVEESQLSMFGTKVELKLKKAEIGSWSRLDVPNSVNIAQLKSPKVDCLVPQIDAVDLDDL